MSFVDNILKRWGLRRMTDAEKKTITIEKVITGEEPRAYHIPPLDTESSDVSRNADGSTYKDPPAVNLSFSTMRQMICDAVVFFGFNVLTLPLRQAKVQVVGERNTPDSRKQISFIQRELIDSGIVNTTTEYTRWGVAMGFAPLELRWTIKDEIVLPREPRLLRWEDTTILEYAEKGENLGEFKGFKYQNSGTSSSEVYLYAQEYKAALFTWLGHLTRGRYGWPQLTPAYEPWRKRRYAILQDYAYYLEKYANPAYKGRFPVGKTGGTDNGDIIKDAMHHLRQGGNVGLPAVFDDKGNSLWDVEPMSPPDRSPVYEAANRVYKAEILQAMLVPERAVTEGVHGTKAEAEAHGEVLDLMRNAIFEDVIELMNISIVKPLLAFNFMHPDPSIHLSFNIISEHKETAIMVVISKILDKWFNGDPIDDATQEEIYKLTGIRLPEPPSNPQPSVSGFASHEHQHGFTDSRTLFAKKDGLKLNRDPDEVERIFYTKNQYLQMLTKQIEDESVLINEVEEIVRDQMAGAETFVRKTWSETQNTPKNRVARIKNYTLRNQGKELKIIKEWLKEQTYKAAYNAFEEQGALMMFPEHLTGKADAWVGTQADIVTSRLIGDVENQVKRLLTEAALRDATDNEAVKVVRDFFDVLLTPGTGASVAAVFSGIANEAISVGRQMLLERVGTTGKYRYNGTGDLGDENEIVAVRRVELMDQNTCEVCRRLDKLTIDATDPRLDKWTAPHWCLGNWSKAQCRGLNLYLRRSMRPEFSEVTMPPDSDPIPPSMKRGAF